MGPVAAALPRVPDVGGPTGGWARRVLSALIDEDADGAGRPARPVRAESARSFEEVYRTHYRDVYRFVLLSSRRPDDTEDIVADTFDRAFRAWSSGRGPAGGSLPWLIVIARRIIVDRWRRDRLLRWLPFQGGHPDRDRGSSDDGRERAEFWIWLDQIAEALSTREREVVFLRYQRDLSDEDIGEILGLSASGVRTLVSRALAALRRHPELWS